MAIITHLTNYPFPEIYIQGRPTEDGWGGFAAAAAVLEVNGGASAGDENLPPPPPMVYSIRSGENRIGNFILHKADFCAGEIVLGNFDFSEASTRCLQVFPTEIKAFCFVGGKGRGEEGRRMELGGEKREGGVREEGRGMG